MMTTLFRVTVERGPDGTQRNTLWFPDRQGFYVVPADKRYDSLETRVSATRLAWFSRRPRAATVSRGRAKNESAPGLHDLGV